MTNPATIRLMSDASEVVNALESKGYDAPDIGIVLCFALVLMNNRYKPPQSEQDLTQFIQLVEKTLRMANDGTSASETLQ